MADRRGAGLNLERNDMRVRAVWLAVVLCVMVAGGATALARDEAVALVVQLAGDVQVERAAGGGRGPARVGMPLLVGDEVTVAQGARAVLLHRSGRTETLTRSHRIAAPATREASSMFQQTMRTLAQVATTDARTQPNRQGMIRPIAGGAVAISPRNELRVLSTRPGFVWFRVDGAEGYTLQVRPADGAPHRFALGADTAWTMPDSVPALARGTMYEWAVGASGNGRISQVQRFRVASKAEARAVSRALQQIRDAGLDPGADGLFMAALAYHDAGFPYEAARALDRLQAAGTPLDTAYYLLRGEVYDALGNLDEAERAFAEAARR
jgi:hypothetical protein